MQVFFSVGEPSGDLHGANLIKALKQRNPDWEYVGFGGPKMAAAGCQLHTDLTQFAVMGIVQVLLHIRTFFKLLAQAKRYFQEQRPDLVVLIDYPGFNWCIARRAKALGIPVVYYGTPQLWAWASWRVSKMRRFVDHALCKLPFEEAWFRQRGCNATFVGHPYFDELKSRQLDAAFVEAQVSPSETLDSPLVTILPGSRTQEVKSNLQSFLVAGKLIQQQVPNTRFAIAAFKSSQLELVNELVEQSGIEVEVHVGRTPELIEAAHCCMACSGSVSLELLYHTKPSVILYQISRLGHVAQLFLRKIRYITLVNLLTAEEPFAERKPGIYDPEDPRDQHVLLPEYLTYGDRTPELAKHVIGWLTDAKKYDELRAKLATLKSEVAQGGASERAAEYISTQVTFNTNSHPVSDAA